MDYTVISELSWRVYPALVLMLAGLGTAVWSVEHGLAAARRHHRDPLRALALLRGFRGGIGGLCLAGVAAGWCGGIEWLLGLSLIIGGQELLESTVVITALRHVVKAAAVRNAA